MGLGRTMVSSRSSSRGNLRQRRDRRRSSSFRTPPRSRSPKGSSGGCNRRNHSRSRSNSAGFDRRPAVEREKGGVKLFVGRLPREVTQRRLKECFEEFGDVLEIFVIDSKALSNVGCAFVRMSKLEDAERAIADLHEQRVIDSEHKELGPMQVAFAKGEARRLGLDEKDETLPSFKDARRKVAEHKEKRIFYETLQKEQRRQQEMLEKFQNFQKEAARFADKLRTHDMESLVKEGQKVVGAAFRERWRDYCHKAWSGCRDYDPARHSRESLCKFLVAVAFDYSRESWFRRKFGELPKLPPPESLPPTASSLPGVPPLFMALPVGMPSVALARTPMMSCLIGAHPMLRGPPIVHGPPPGVVGPQDTGSSLPPAPEVHGLAGPPCFGFMPGILPRPFYGVQNPIGNAACGASSDVALDVERTAQRGDRETHEARAKIDLSSDDEGACLHNALDSDGPSLQTRLASSQVFECKLDSDFSDDETHGEKDKESGSEGPRLSANRFESEPILHGDAGDIKVLLSEGGTEPVGLGQLEVGKNDDPTCQGIASSSEDRPSIAALVAGRRLLDYGDVDD